MKILAYIVAIFGVAIAAYGAFLADWQYNSATALFGVAIVIFASILHRESCGNKSS